MHIRLKLPATSFSVFQWWPCSFFRRSWSDSGPKISAEEDWPCFRWRGWEFAQSVDFGTGWGSWGDWNKASFLLFHHHSTCSESASGISPLCCLSSTPKCAERCCLPATHLSNQLSPECRSSLPPPLSRTSQAPSEPLSCAWLRYEWQDGSQGPTWSNTFISILRLEPSFW